MALETIITDRWETKGPRWPTEVVASGAILAFNDAHTTGKLHPATRKALDRMWTVQRADGSWKWLNCDYPPMESDDHYGVTIAAIGVGVAPDGYAQSAGAREGLAKVKSYLRANPGEHLHQRAMVLWASTYLPDLELMTGAERTKCIDELLSLQHPDGGWSAATLGGGNVPTIRPRTPPPAMGTARASSFMCCGGLAWPPPIPDSRRASHGSRPTSGPAGDGSPDRSIKTVRII